MQLFFLCAGEFFTVLRSALDLIVHHAIIGNGVLMKSMNA